MTGKIVHKGFHDFSKGTMGNGGQNLYVSRQGVLQRIFRFDTTGNGYFDIMITNSHDFNEHPKLQIISNITDQVPDIKYILTEGSHAAAVADLNKDGYDDLIIGSCNNGHHSDLSAYVYYGGPEGITENHKIDLPAPGCIGVACGDFNGDGLCDIAFIIEGGKLRIYYQTEIGFVKEGYKDLEIDLTHITSADIDGDGYSDLYCRIRDGEWVVLRGGKEGIDILNQIIVGEKTDDTIFDTLPFGGGNLGYAEEARPKILTIDGVKYLLYCNKEKAVLKRIDECDKIVTHMMFEIPGVISAGSGDIDGDGKDDLVFLCRPKGKKEKALIYYGGNRGFEETHVETIETKTARDVLINDFSGNGYGDIAICQGRDDYKFTTESLLYTSSKEGVSKEPKRFITHNAVGVLSANTNGEGNQLIFVNHQQSDTYGHVPAYIYTGDKDGYKPQRRVELPGHSPGTMIPADFNDNGYTDILLINDGEDQPHLNPPSTIYWGGKNGIEPDNFTNVPTYLSWGAQVADINKDGYLDIVFTSCNQRAMYNKNIVTVLYGSKRGYSTENSETITIAPDDDLCGIGHALLADFNNNGWLDIFISLSRKCYSMILFGGSEGYSLERSIKLPVSGAWSAKAADLNGNGWLDLIISCKTGVMIYWGGPDGFSSGRCCELPSYMTNTTAIADFNNDGYLDIFASSYFNSIERDANSYIYWNNKGSFSVTNRKRFFSHSASGSIATDLNEDGYTDLVVANHRAYGSHRSESVIWWNGSEGFDEKKRTYLPSLGPHDMVDVDVGNIFDRGNEEYYTSPVIELASGNILEKISWEADIPEKTWVCSRIRSANKKEELEEAIFVGPDGTENSYYKNGEETDNSFITGNFIQYRLLLGAINSVSTPRVTSVTVEFK